jgi:Dyp-type peroxidase family
MDRILKVHIAGKGEIAMREQVEAKDLLNNVDRNGEVLLIDPFDKNDPHWPLLSNLQSNILKGHDRDFVIHVFLHFKEGCVERIKKTIRCHADEKNPDHITSTRVQLDEWKRYHFHRISGGASVSFYLTAAGYRALGYTLEENKWDAKFLKGMQGSQENLNDPDPRRWEQPYRQSANKDVEQETKEIHAMISIADDDDQYLGRQAKKIVEELLNDEKGDLGEAIGFEHGKVRRDETQEPLEHFGFRDGISNPMFLTIDKRKIDKYGGETNYKPWAPLKVALVKDPLMDNDDTAVGSYLVYRKLEQHVRKFESVVRNLALALDLDSSNESELDRVKALIMGRFQDGTPISLKQTSYGGRYSDENYNNFTYNSGLGDPGTKCPFHAHIRKVNPRDKDYKERRIVRRGITYGERSEYREKRGIDSLPDGGVGLLFMCFQSDIANQFEDIQKEMANNSSFPKNETGLDAIIGQPAKVDCSLCKGTGDYPKDSGNQCPNCDGTKKVRGDEPVQNWPFEWGKGSYSYSGAMSSCVTLKGGEYFFAPSISFLKTMPEQSSRIRREEL